MKSNRSQVFRIEVVTKVDNKIDIYIMTLCRPSDYQSASGCIRCHPSSGNFYTNTSCGPIFLSMDREYFAVLTFFQAMRSSSTFFRDSSLSHTLLAHRRDGSMIRSGIGSLWLKLLSRPQNSSRNVRRARQHKFIYKGVRT